MKNMVSIKNTVLDKVDDISGKILDLCTYLYNNPETALKEVESSKKVAEFLKNEGFEVEMGVAGLPTAFKATKKNGSGPRIALIAEYDALPVDGHACGHHLITGIGVGTGIALAEILGEYEGEVTVFGTPAEETGEGKPVMCRAGLFDGYDVAMMLHPDSKTCLRPEIITIGGYDFIFHGKAAHAGGNPHDGINALDGVVMLYNGVSVLRQQLKDGTRVHGIIMEGGTVANSIPDRCSMRLEVRSADLDYYHETFEKVINCAKAAALATGCELEYFQSEPTCLGLRENEALIKVYEKNMLEMGIEEDIKSMLLGSTDMGDVGEVVPSIHPMLKVTRERYDLHTMEFLKASIDEYAYEQMFRGIKALCLTGIDLFEKPELLKGIKEEFENRK